MTMRGIMNVQATYSDAMQALDQLCVSRTGESFAIVLSATSDVEKMTALKRRIYDEKLWDAVAHVMMSRPESESYGLNDIAGAIVKAADMHLRIPELEAMRKAMAEHEGGSAYYDLDTNAQLPFGYEDLFGVIQRAEKRFVWDKNSPLPVLDSCNAYIIGQTFDREDDFWLRRDVRRGHENLYAFGVTNLFGRLCLHIQRLTKPVVTSLFKRRNSIPAPKDHYGDTSHALEIQVILQSREWGKERLTAEILRLKEVSTGSYQICILIARRCAALLLLEDDPLLKNKVAEENQKFATNHQNALGDTNLIQNALYLDAAIITRDTGVQKMAAYCGLKCLN